MDFRVVLIAKPECHLCENARLTIAQVCGELGVAWTELSIHDDPKLAIEYFESVPVVRVDGRQHAQYRVDETRFRAVLTDADDG